MRSLWLGILLATVESLAFGQLDSDTLTVTVSQSVNLQPDQIVFVIRTSTPASTGLDEVVTSLKGSGITAANFSNVSSIRDRATLTWLFTLPVPFSKIAATAAQLDAQKIQFSIQGAQASPEAERAQQCSIPSMMADARARAKKMAEATELAVGDILAISGGNASPGIQLVGFVTGSAAVSRLDNPVGFSQVQPVYSAVQYFSVLAYPVRPPVNCFLTVKFKLLRYHY